jgi:hypothetical protein
MYGYSGKVTSPVYSAAVLLNTGKNYFMTTYIYKINYNGDIANYTVPQHSENFFTSKYGAGRLFQ